MLFWPQCLLKIKFNMSPGINYWSDLENITSAIKQHCFLCLTISSKREGIVPPKMSFIFQAATESFVRTISSSSQVSSTEMCKNIKVEEETHNILWIIMFCYTWLCRRQKRANFDETLKWHNLIVNWDNNRRQHGQSYMSYWKAVNLPKNDTQWWQIFLLQYPSSFGSGLRTRTTTRRTSTRTCTRPRWTSMIMIIIFKN